MKAIRLATAGQSLQLQDVPAPTLRSGGVIVRVQSSPVLSYMRQVVDGTLGYSMPTPFTPGAGAVGIVEAVADDVFDLAPGTAVFCDPYMYSHSNSGAADAMLIGLTGMSPQSARLQNIWRDGTFAEQVLWPAEALIPISQLSGSEHQRIAYLGKLAVPYGGLLSGELRPGQTVIINGATGAFGSAGVLVALAMGAGKVIAVGRDEDTLAKIQQSDTRRVVPVALTGQLDGDSAKLNEVAQGADLVLDFLGRVTTPDPTLACLQALRPRGTAVLMGGVQADVPLAYAHIMHNEITIRGAYMYPRHAPSDLLDMIAAGTLDLSKLTYTSFGLEQIDAALDRAAQLHGFDYVVVTP